MESTIEPSSIPTPIDGKTSTNLPEKTLLSKESINVLPKTPQKQIQQQIIKQQSKQQVSFFKTIPRTIRWRIQLGLLSLPPSVSTAVDAANLTLKNSARNQNKDVQQNQQSEQDSHTAVNTVLKSETISKPSYTLKDVFQYNQKIIQEQHERFDQLSKKHLWENSPLALIEKEEREANEKSNKSTSADTKETNEKVLKVPCTNGSDPLSAMMMEDKQTNEKETDRQDQSNDSNAKESTNNDKKEKSSWSEFYSSRETLSLIEKDLHRLSPSHHIVTQVSTLYASSPDKTNTPNLEDTQQNDDNHKSTDVAIGSNDTNDSKTDHEEYKKKQRSQLLAQILFIYARQNPSLGYRQGMHEILSFILIAFEIDFHNAYNRNKKQTQTDQTGSTEDDENAYRLSFFVKDKLSHDLFLIFETIMYHLSPGYDFESTTITPPPHLSKTTNNSKEEKNNIPSTTSSSMDHIAETILRHVRLNGSEELHHHLTNEINIPPQLYCARWVRLMFIREIPSVEKSLFLWDKIFHNMHRKHLYLISILEFICAAMILRIQDKFGLRHDNMDHYNNSYDDEDFDPNESINLLMNYPPIDDIKGFWKLVADLIDGRHRKPSIMKKQNIVSKTASSAIHTVQNLARPLVMGAGRAINSSSPQQIYSRQYHHEQQHQQHFNGVFNRMTNIYNEKRNSNEANDNSSSNQMNHPKSPLHPLQFPRGKSKYDHEHQGIYNEDNHHYQKDAMHQTFSRVTNTFSKAIDSIGGSIENFVNATSQGNINHRNIAFDGSKNTWNSSAKLPVDQQLSKSVQTISKYLQETGMNVPNDVWEALATVDSIGSQILASQPKRV